MPHVGDGEIHAYLDGALDLFPSAEAERIRDHLRSCPDCARRLAEERSLRESAEAILSGAGPEIGDPPPFEEIRARASAQGPPKAPRMQRLPPTLLPWAASIVLALAVGWGARDTSLNRRTITPDLATRSALEGAGARAEDAERLGTEVLDAVGRGGAAPAATGEGAVATVGAVALDADAAPQDAFRATNEPTGRDAGRGQNAPGPPAVSVLSDNASAVAKATADASEEQATAQEAPAAPAESEIAALADRAAAEPEAGEPSDLRARRALAESPEAQARFDEANERTAQQVAAEGGERREQLGALESSVDSAGLMVPGLQVESIEVDPTLGPRGGLRVVQRLPSGERLELLFVTGAQDAPERDALAEAAFTAADELVLPATPDGWSRIRVPRPGGLLVAQGAVPSDSLAALVTHLR